MLVPLFVLAPLSSVFGAIKAHVRTKTILNREIHDEHEASDLADCLALGELDVVFRTKNDGAPRVGVVLTDPRGRRIGFDPLTKNSWDEMRVAQGYIDCDSSYIDGSCRGVVQVCGPVSGAYKLEVIGRNVSVYSLGISARSERTKAANRFYHSLSEADIRSVPARRGSRDMFSVSYSREVNTNVVIQMHPIAKLKQGAIRLRAANIVDRQASRPGTSLRDRSHAAGD